MSTHTPAPWFTSKPNEGGGTLIKPIPGQVIAQCDLSENMEANAKRIVNCVNACEGLPDDCFDGGWTAAGASAYAKKLEVGNAELLWALETAKRLFETAELHHLLQMFPCIDSAIAKARGEA